MARHRTGSPAAMQAREALFATMKAHVLDTIDLQILRTLQANGRASNVALAEHAGITAPPALRRTAALQDRGVIKGVHARLDAEKLGYAVTAFISVGLASQTGNMAQCAGMLRAERPS
jgi:DNA-binding Lrp family transcriptional regulator